MHIILYSKENTDIYVVIRCFFVVFFVMQNGEPDVLFFWWSIQFSMCTICSGKKLLQMAFFFSEISCEMTYDWWPDLMVKHKRGRDCRSHKWEHKIFLFSCVQVVLLVCSGKGFIIKLISCGSKRVWRGSNEVIADGARLTGVIKSCVSGG